MDSNVKKGIKVVKNIESLYGKEQDVDQQLDTIE
jgi:hypothetical protein